MAIKVYIKPCAVFSKNFTGYAAEKNRVAVEVNPECTILDLKTMLDLPSDDIDLILVNGILRDDNYRLQEYDLVMFVPVIAGG